MALRGIWCVPAAWLLLACVDPATEDLRASDPLETDGVDDYYVGIVAGSPAQLREALHERIKDHVQIPYDDSTPGDVDTWEVLEAADEDLGDDRFVRDIYRDALYRKVASGRPYNREHAWPRSFGFPVARADNLPLSDCHALFIVDAGYNSARNNKPYNVCETGCWSKRTTTAGVSNWTKGYGARGSWKTWPGRRGDVARALLYLDVRYAGGIHAPTDSDEPDLVLTDDRSLMLDSLTTTNASVAYMGFRSVLLDWHEQDPVDERERHRNEVVFAYQQNRNPFIDHPEWVACVFQDDCAPLPPTE
jgi:endonuclease I